MVTAVSGEGVAGGGGNATVVTCEPSDCRGSYRSSELIWSVLLVPSVEIEHPSVDAHLDAFGLCGQGHGLHDAVRCARSTTVSDEPPLLVT